MGTAKTKETKVAIADVNRPRVTALSICGFCSCEEAWLGSILKNTAKIGIEMNSINIKVSTHRITSISLLDRLLNFVCFSSFAPFLVIRLHYSINGCKLKMFMFQIRRFAIGFAHRLKARSSYI